METLREKLSEKLKQVIEELPSNVPSCRECMKRLILFIHEHEELDQFEDFEFDTECVNTKNRRGEPWCWNQITLLKHGKEIASLTFKMFGGKFEAEIVDLDLFERNYDLF